MTLLLTCVTPRFAVQASDRRLTMLTGAVTEEAANKATLLCRHAIFAYTGLAQCSAVEPTDELLMRCLAERAPINVALDKLAKEASHAIRNLQLRVPKHQRRSVRRTSFVGGGFLGMRDPGRFGRPFSPDELHPFLAVISNAQDLTEQWRTEADQQFTVHVGYLGDEPFMLHAAGQAFDGLVRTRLERDIRRSLGRIAHPQALARLLARAVRAVAATNPLVGPNVMCTMVRRDIVRYAGKEILTGGMVPLVPGLEAESSYFRWPKDDNALSQWIYSPAGPGAFPYYGPNYACNGLQAKGIMMTRGSAPPSAPATQLPSH